MSSYAYKHIDSPKNVGSGVADEFYFAPKSAFTAIQCPPATGTNPGDTVTIATAHTFPANAGFTSVLCAPFKNALTATTVGDIGATKHEQKLEVFVPGVSPELNEMMANLKNEPCIVLIKDSNCAAGVYYQMGCDCAFAWASTEFTTGTNRDGAKGWKVTFTYFTDAVLLYTAAVTKHS